MGCEQRASNDMEANGPRSNMQSMSDSLDSGIQQRAKRLAHHGHQMADVAIEKSVMYGGSLVDAATEVADELKVQCERLARLQTDELFVLSEEILAEVGDDINLAGARINELLDHIAQAPDAKLTPKEKLNGMVVLMVPVVGPTQRYANARKLHEVGIRNGNLDQIQSARRDCLIAFAEMGLDIGMLGVAGTQIDAVATGADRVLGVLKMSRKVNSLVGDDLAIFDAFLDDLLANAIVCGAVDKALAMDFSKICPSDS